MRNTTLLCGVLLCLLVHLGTPKGSFVMKKPLKIDVKYQKKSQKINKQNIGSHRNKQSTATIKSPTGPMSDVSRGLMNNFLSLTSHIKGRIETYLTLIFQKRRKMSQKTIKNRHLSASYDLGSDSRIQKELRNFIQEPLENVKLSVGNNIRQWIITVVGADDTIYAGEKFRLKFSFPPDYPFSPPSVYFLHPIPKHEHVYSNGDICLNLLGPGWMPTMTAQGIAMSIVSMLSTAKEKKIPPDNAVHADTSPGQQQVNWMYHDDKC